jgi:hypothetical protein
MRRAAVVVSLALLTTLPQLSGCGPAVSEKELGTIEYEVPQVPGAEKPYKLPAVAPKTTPDPMEQGPGMLRPPLDPQGSDATPSRPLGTHPEK